jgi:hypothetical protein
MLFSGIFLDAASTASLSSKAGSDLCKLKLVDFTAAGKAFAAGSKNSLAHKKINNTAITLLANRLVLTLEKREPITNTIIGNAGMLRTNLFKR